MPQHEDLLDHLIEKRRSAYDELRAIQDNCLPTEVRGEGRSQCLSLVA